MTRALVALVAYAVIYALSLAHLAQQPGFGIGEPLAILVIFGAFMSALAWLTTRGIVPRPHPVRAPARESLVLLAYLAVFALGFLGWGLSAVKAAVPGEPAQTIAVVVAKLLAMVGAPLLVFGALGYDWRELLALPRLAGREWVAFGVMAVALLALQALVGRGVQAVAALPEPAWLVAAFVPVTVALMCIEAGLTEEFLFRVLVQTRFAAWMKSEVAGIVAMALLFGLAHAPGYVLRGAHLFEGMDTAPSPLTAAAYSIAIVSVIGLMFGVLWARTRSLLLVVLLHGLTDTIPNLAPTVRAFLEP
jgi:membrane protease YdiL (CAAX protease family)